MSYKVSPGLYHRPEWTARRQARKSLHENWDGYKTNAIYCSLQIYRTDFTGSMLAEKTNSILRSFPIPAANLCRVRIEGLALPFSSLLISPWAIPVRFESSFCVSPEVFLPLAPNGKVYALKNNFIDISAGLGYI